MIDRETAAVGFVKTAILATAAAATDAFQNGTLPAWSSWVMWILTAMYAMMQVVKGLPWFTDQARAFWRGVLRGDWSHWWRLARRSESAPEDDNGDH